jgi:hypothetical protein
VLVAVGDFAAGAESCVVVERGQLAGGHELDVSGGDAADRAGRGDHHRRGHAGLDPGLVVPVPGQGPGVLAVVLAYLVKADFDGFPVPDAVAASWQTHSLTPRRVTDSGPGPAGHAPRFGRV